MPVPPKNFCLNRMFADFQAKSGFLLVEGDERRQIDSQAGGNVEQRGKWQTAVVFAALNAPDRAFAHADSCSEFCLRHLPEIAIVSNFCADLPIDYGVGSFHLAKSLIDVFLFSLAQKFEAIPLTYAVYPPNVRESKNHRDFDCTKKFFAR